MTEVADETISPESGEDSIPPDTGLDEKAEFERKVNALVGMMQDDPLVRDRIIAETYVNIANTELTFRRIMALMQEQGIGGMMKGMLRRNKENG